MKGMNIEIPLPPITMRAALPVVRGQNLLWSGELLIGRTRIHVVGTTPLEDAERYWERATSYAASHRKMPLRLGDVLDEETGDIRPGVEDVEGIFDDVTNFMTSSPIGKTIEHAASFVPGLNMASSAAFGAAKLYKAAKKKAKKHGRHSFPTRLDKLRAPLPTSKSLRGPVDFARAMQRKLQQQGRLVQQYSEEDMTRAAQAVELSDYARAGNPEALRLIGKMRTLPYAPASSDHLDLLALDAAQLVGEDSELDDYLEEEASTEGVTGGASPKAGRAGGEIITADSLRAAFEGGRSCGCP